MTLRPSLAIGALALCFLTLPCLAGPCSKDIAGMQARIDARLNALAAAGPSAKQSVEAQTHRQPTPRSMASAERELGELSPNTIVKVNEAMERAQKADAAGDDTGCRRALDEVARIIGP
jgi:hypothetical protein